MDAVSARKSEEGEVFVDIIGVDAGDNLDRSREEFAELAGATFTTSFMSVDKSSPLPSLPFSSASCRVSARWRGLYVPFAIFQHR